MPRLLAFVLALSLSPLALACGSYVLGPELAGLAWAGASGGDGARFAARHRLLFGLWYGGARDAQGRHPGQLHLVMRNDGAPGSRNMDAALELPPGVAWDPQSCGDAVVVAPTTEPGVFRLVAHVALKEGFSGQWFARDIRAVYDPGRANPSSSAYRFVGPPRRSWQLAVQMLPFALIVLLAWRRSGASGPAGADEGHARDR